MSTNEELRNWCADCTAYHSKNKHADINKQPILQYQPSKEPEYDVEEAIDEILQDAGTDLPNVHNVFLCRDGRFYYDPDVPHHDDEVRELGYLVGMEFSDNEDVTSDDIHEFMYKTGLIRGHRFEEVPQYDFDIVFPPSVEQIKTMWNLAISNPEIDVGWAIGESEQVYGRGIDGLMKTVQEQFPPSVQANLNASSIKSFRTGEGYFIRAFFADALFNDNKWGVTQEALNRDISSGIEKDYFGKTAPVIDTPDDSHPPDDAEDMIKEQEPHRKGDFVRIGIDKKSNRSYFDAIITDQRTIDRIESGELKFGSPSIKALEAVHTADGKTKVTRFKINHWALVKNPAYGMKAQIRGRCLGTAEQCLHILDNVQADKRIPVKCASLCNLNSAEMSPEQIVKDIKSKKPVQINTDLMETQSTDHSSNPLEAEDYTCPHCGDQHQNIDQLSQHLLLKHPDKKAQSDLLEPPKPCKVCGQPYDEHNANTGHEYHAEDTSEQINQTREYGAERKELIKNAIKQADECVSKWIPELSKAHPEWEQKQVVAVAYAKCRKGENAEVVYNKDKTRPNEVFEGKKTFFACIECKNQFKSEQALNSHIKTTTHGIKKGLIANYSKKNNMSSVEENKGIESEEDRRKRLEKEKEQANKMAELTEQVKTFSAVIDAEIKAPIASKIVQARIKAGAVKEADKQASIDELMKHGVAYLKGLESDYSAMLKIAESKSQNAPTSPRFSYSASQIGDKPETKNVLDHIRSRMQ